MQPIYKLVKVNKFYDEKNKALIDISLEIKTGEIVVILGPSGSGKSTMLNLLAGIDVPTSGEIFFNDLKIDNLNEDELTDYRFNNLGFIFQSYNLISTLNTKENIELGMNKTTDLDINNIIDLIDLEAHIDKYPYQLSGGQMQRIAIARAMIKNPRVIFCDEPTGALDEEMGKKILEAIHEINKKYKTTVIIVTHNPSIADMANTVIKMKSGKIESITKNKKVLKASELRWA